MAAAQGVGRLSACLSAATPAAQAGARQHAQAGAADAHAVARETVAVKRNTRNAILLEGIVLLLGVPLVFVDPDLAGGMLLILHLPMLPLVALAAGFWWEAWHLDTGAAWAAFIFLIVAIIVGQIAFWRWVWRDRPPRHGKQGASTPRKEADAATPGEGRETE